MGESLFKQAYDGYRKAANDKDELVFAVRTMRKAAELALADIEEKEWALKQVVQTATDVLVKVSE